MVCFPDNPETANGKKKDSEVNIQKVSQFLPIFVNTLVGRLSIMTFILGLADILLLHSHASQLSFRDRN